MTPEGAVKLAVKRLLKQYRNVYFVMVVPTGFGMAGIHDFIICVEGRFFSVECKATAKDAPTALQDGFTNNVARAGGVSLVVHKGNLAVLEVYLAMLGAVRK